MSKYVDYILKSPRNIDFYFYTPGAGGEFFSSLAILANKNNHEIIHDPRLLGKKRKAKNNQGESVDSITFSTLAYFKQMHGIHIGLEDIGFNLFYVWDHFSNPNDRINYIKMVLFHYLQSHIRRTVPVPRIDHIQFADFDSTSIYHNKTFIFSTHWINFLPAAPGGPTKCTLEKYRNRSFGIPIFEDQEYWDAINIDPQSKKGQNFVIKWTQLNQLSREEGSVYESMNHPARQNMKLKFPFMDYMIEKDYDSIKYWLENRYGSDLDFDFIDQSLKFYSELRIDPWL